MKKRYIRITGMIVALILCILSITIVATATGVQKEHTRGSYSIDFSQSGQPGASGRRYTAGGNVAFCI